MASWIRLGFDQHLICTWSDGTVLYNTLSGQTHVLSPGASNALRAISDMPATTDALFDAMVRALPDSDVDALRAELDELLPEMARLGVIAPGEP